MKINQMRKAKSIYSVFLCNKGVNHHHFGRDTKADRRAGKLYSGKKTRLLVCPDWRLLAWRSCSQAHYKRGILCDWLGMHN